MLTNPALTLLVVVSEHPASKDQLSAAQSRHA
jgi:hypothetical protein